MNEILEIDGSQGEGGGQMVRSSLALAVACGIPVRIRNVRAGRGKPGLLRQHLTAARAVAEICGGTLEGARIGSSEVVLWPGAVRAGEYTFAIGSAGSTSLVLQAVLPALLTANGPSRVTVTGGTHNSKAPPFDFLAESLLPILQRTGPKLDAALLRAGFMPAGGGEVRVDVTPATELRPLSLLERGAEQSHRCRIHVSQIAPHVADNEWMAVQKKMRWKRSSFEKVEHTDAACAGNSICLVLRFDNVCEVVTMHGARDIPSRRVAQLANREAIRYLADTAPVGPHLADQLLVPLALLAGGEFVTSELTEHTRTNAEVLRKFCGDDSVVIDEEHPGGVRVRVQPPGTTERTPH